jgi:hypothetical protein
MIPTGKPSAASMLSVYDGRACVGFLLNRGRSGVEAFTADERSLGLYPTQDAGAAALWRHAHKQPLEAPP